MKQFLKGFTRLRDFKGRSCRKDFWMFVLFSIIIFYVSSSFTFLLANMFKTDFFTFIPKLYLLIIVLPSVALVVRRLHDINMQGWLGLLIFVPIFGQIVMILLLITESDLDKNKYGYPELDSDCIRQKKNRIIDFVRTYKIDSQKSKNPITEIINFITKFSLVGKLNNVNFGKMFSGVLKKHPQEEEEEYFSVGLRATTPQIMNVSVNPKPWFFFKTLIGAILIYFLLYLGWKLFDSIILIPGLIVTGSFAVPIAITIFFHEINIRNNVSLYQLIRMFFLGGVVSLILSLFLFQITDMFELNWLGASIAGIVEEPGKIMALFLIINVRKYKYIHNGLLFGAAVGAGFAAFESAGYALMFGIYGNEELIPQVILLRGILSPFGHIVWTSMCGAVLWKIKSDKRLQFKDLKDKRFIRILLVAILLHMIWNLPIGLSYHLHAIPLGFVAWVIILALIQRGNEQIKEEKDLVAGTIKEP